MDMISKIKLREVAFDDWKLLLSWRNEIETRKNSHNMEMVDEENHKNWLKDSLLNKKRKIYIAMHGTEEVGTVRSDLEKDVFLLSWSVAPEARGRGFGKMIVKALVDKLKSKVRAEIKKDNISSIKIAEFAGLKLMKEEKDILHYNNN